MEFHASRYQQDQWIRPGGEARIAAKACGLGMMRNDATRAKTRVHVSNTVQHHTRLVART